MIVFISPTKRLRQVSTHMPLKLPIFKQQTAEIMDRLKQQSQEELMKILHVKENLAQENYLRYQQFEISEEGTPALLAFQGIQYQYMGLEEDKLSWDYVDEHIRILDALYGVLEPRTSIFPYRLDMLSKLKIKNQNLYQYWNDSIAMYIQKEVEHHQEPIAVCLASKEYQEMIAPHYPNLVHVEFQIVKNGQRKVESTQVKMARGRMIGYIIRNQIETRIDLEKFDEDGYIYDEHKSNTSRLVFLKGDPNEICD